MAGSIVFFFSLKQLKKYKKNGPIGIAESGYGAAGHPGHPGHTGIYRRVGKQTCSKYIDGSVL